MACYRLRLYAAARRAREAGVAAFTTSLLYSTRQLHAEIAVAAGEAAADVGVPFLYRDFRVGGREGRQLCHRLDVYRQSYCGCLYGELDN
jgi:predicted adenine nucleotide alpha hydrolase (AANH) superfamily ATPase